MIALRPLGSRIRTTRTSLATQRPVSKRLRTPSDKLCRRTLGRYKIAVRASVDPVDRALGAAPYLLPLLDGLPFGKYLFDAYPIFIRILKPIEPLAVFYNSLPYSSLIMFFLLYFGVAKNTRFNRFVRFNAMQAILIDILQILPGLLFSLMRVSNDIKVPIYNSTWLYIFCCTVIGIGSCVVGQSARLPLVADASDAQVDR